MDYVKKNTDKKNMAINLSMLPRADHAFIQTTIDGGLHNSQEWGRRWSYQSRDIHTFVSSLAYEGGCQGLIKEFF